MRTSTFLFGILMMANAAAQTPVPTADEVLKPAFARAAQSNKNILLIFHASWCGWCRRLDASLADETVKPFFDKNYEIVHLTVHESPGKKDLENPGALQFLARHGATDSGLPYWFVLDKSGTVLADSQRVPGENTGCPASEKEVDYFIDVLKKTSASNEAEIEKIRVRFRKNEN